jgi:hypothetical protein
MFEIAARSALRRTFSFGWQNKRGRFTQEVPIRLEGIILLDAHFGSKARVELAYADFRFIPQSRHAAVRLDCPLSAKTGRPGAAVLRSKVARHFRQCPFRDTRLVDSCVRPVIREMP